MTKVFKASQGGVLLIDDVGQNAEGDKDRSGGRQVQMA